MKPDAYARNIAARAFDVARYLLFWGVPTNVGQVTSIRTLEKQIKRLRVSEFAEVRELGDEIAQACAEPPMHLDRAGARTAGATLARHAEPDEYLRQSREDLKLWAAQNLTVDPTMRRASISSSRTMCSTEIAATLLYPVAIIRSARFTKRCAAGARRERRRCSMWRCESRGGRDDLLRGFRGGQYCFDMLIDIGAYRDMHRHRRCHQYRQAYAGRTDTTSCAVAIRRRTRLPEAMDAALAAMQTLPDPARQYLLPFGARSRFLFKMDFAEVEYISRVRSG